MRDVQGLSTKQAAQLLGISEGAVKVRLHRAHAS
jgi:DNA-directed RNA polymerase specialized sigma24 family protein